MRSIAPISVWRATNSAASAAAVDQGRVNTRSICGESAVMFDTLRPSGHDLTCRVKTGERHRLQQVCLTRLLVTGLAGVDLDDDLTTEA